jgi:hypothetical protein
LAHFSILTPYPRIVINGALIEWVHVKVNFFYRYSKKAVHSMWWGDERHKLGLGTIFTFIEDSFWGK